MPAKVKRQKVIRVRTSERKLFADCRMAWYWGYVLNLKPKVTSPAFKFGDLIHQCLAIYYPPGKKRGPNPSDTLIELWAQLEDDLKWIYTEEGEREDALELGVDMLDNYVRWSAPLDKQYEIISAEQPFQVEVTDDDGNYMFTYVGTLDAVVRDLHTKKIGFIEHKTSRGLPLDLYLPLDEQAGSYWAFAPDWMRANKILKPKEDMDFILYNVLRKAKADNRPTNQLGQALNQDGTVSKRQPNPLFDREVVYRNPNARSRTVQRAKDQFREMQEIQLGERLPLKSPSKDCKFCQYKEMCELEENGGDWEGYRDAMFNVWSPYEDHLPIPTQETR